MNPTKSDYLATFILDTRTREEPVETIIEELKKEIEAASGEVTGVENLGTKEFVRVTDERFPAGIYVEIALKGEGDIAGRLHERFRLNKTVYRLLVQQTANI